MDVSYFIKKARQICGNKNIFTDRLRLLSYGTDASFYRYLPKAIVKASGENEIISLIKLASQTKTAVTFRAAGTSLSGQTIGDSIIILCAGEHFKKLEIEDNGNSIKMAPGVIAGQANIRLKEYKRKLGPDPASVNSATIGGIVANNASGMTAGIWSNSYRTLQDIRLVFADGSILDTSDNVSMSEFKKSHLILLEGLKKIHEKIQSTPELAQRIRQKYQIKNTTGYGLNSFIDFDDPIEILKHLIVGSEGTLAYISEISMETIPLKNFKSVGLLFFPDLLNACNAALLLNDNKVDAIELIDRKALKAIEDNRGIPEFIKSLEKEVTCLLVEFSSDNIEELEIKSQKLKEELILFNPVKPIEFMQDVKAMEDIWKVRKGIFPSVGANRKPGTTVVIEDVAFRLELLPRAIDELRDLLDKHEYTDAVIYGHANDGNVHFIFSEDFNSPEGLNRYRKFMDEVVDLVVNRFDGSLKAEHGTGRNMAPFVKIEWGEELFQIMKEIKHLFDPDGVFNPGVLINDDNEIHLKNFKPMPAVHPLINKCIECGFCEINCLSNEFALSSRQRIISYRELKTLKPAAAGKFKKQFIEIAEQTCAADGLCAISCPVDIDTGLLIKSFRNALKERHSNPVAGFLARNMKILTKLVGTGLGILKLLANIFGEKGASVLFGFIHFISFRTIPKWHKYFPVNARFKSTIKPKENLSDCVVYFPSCINRSMGPAWISTDKHSLTDITLMLLERAGYSVIFPKETEKLCCGTPWESKGYFKIADKKSLELEQALLKASENGKYPILFDTSPCLYRMRNFSGKKLGIYEPVEFALNFLINRLSIDAKGNAC